LFVYFKIKERQTPYIKTLAVSLGQQMKLRLTHIIILMTCFISCYRFEIYKENRKQMVHFVNGTEGELTIIAFPTTAVIFEGNWFNVPIEKIDYSQPIVAYRTNQRDSIFYSHKFERAIKSDTTIIVGDSNFLKELIIYTPDNFPDTVGNRIYYAFDTNFDKFRYNKVCDLRGNLISEGLEIPKYVYLDHKPTLSYPLVSVGVQKYYVNGTVHTDTVRFRGIESLPVRFKGDTYR
jgi:hypothetical protein